MVVEARVMVDDRMVILRWRIWVLLSSVSDVRLWPHGIFMICQTDNFDLMNLHVLNGDEVHHQRVLKSISSLYVGVLHP